MWRIHKAGKHHQQTFHPTECEIQEAAELQEQMKSMTSEIQQQAVSSRKNK